MNKTKYILVEWPECQLLEEADKLDDCYFMSEIYAYMVPENIYEEIYEKKKS